MPVSSSTRIDLGPSHGVRMRRDRVAMRDGVHLNASVYTPRSGQRVPAVIELTPYMVDGSHAEGLYFPSRGLAYVVADVRGRGDSDGDFRQSFNDAADAVDLIDWIIQQPWSDGRVVLFGGSYSGLGQWLILGMRHPAVVAASPATVIGPGIDIPRGGVANAYHFKWRAEVLGTALYSMSGTDGGLWAQEIRECLAEGRPIWTAAEAFGVPYDDDLRRFIERPGLEHWADLRPTDEQLTGLDVPVLTVTGTHDGSLPGTLYHWGRFQRLAGRSALERSHLLVGPWSHGGTETGHPVVGDLQFDDLAHLPMREMRTDWFRHVLFGEPLPHILTDRVVYYVAGAEEWRSAPTIESATVEFRPLYLRSTEGPNDVFHSGWLVDVPADGPDYTMAFDPMDPRAIDLELVPHPSATAAGPIFSLVYNSLFMVHGGDDPTNQVFTTTIDGDGLVYHSRPLSDPLTIVGTPSLRLVVVPDQADADVVILLHEVRPDGQPIFVSSDMVRLSRCLPEGETALRVGEPNVVDIASFRFCSRQFGPGSRIRLSIRSAWSTLVLPSTDGLRTHPSVTLQVLHRAGEPTMLTLPLGESS